MWTAVCLHHRIPCSTCPQNVRHPPATEWQPPPPAQPSLRERSQEIRPPPAVPSGDVRDGDWPLPPPPVALPDEASEPPPVHAVQPPGLVEELIERLGKLEARLTPAPSPPLYDEPESVNETGPVTRNPPPRLSVQANSFVPRQSLSYLGPLLIVQERTYRGPKPSIPKFVRDDQSEFARLRIALENILPADATERFKYQVLCDHLKFEEAILIADSYSNSLYPYSDTMASLIKHYSQSHQLSLRRIAELMDEPSIRPGDVAGFRKFALRVRALVGMLEQLGEEGHIELQCGSHVMRLTRKLPQDLRATFRRYLYPRQNRAPSLMDFATWLEHELVIQEGKDKLDAIERKGEDSKNRKGKEKKAGSKPTMVLHGAA